MKRLIGPKQKLQTFGRKNIYYTYLDLEHPPTNLFKSHKSNVLALKVLQALEQLLND